MSKKLTLFEYISYYDTELNKRFKEEYKLLFLKLENEMMSSKKFINFSRGENILDIDFLKSVYNEYFDFMIKNLD